MSDTYAIKADFFVVPDPAGNTYRLELVYHGMVVPAPDGRKRGSERRRRDWSLTRFISMASLSSRRGGTISPSMCGFPTASGKARLCWFIKPVFRTHPRTSEPIHEFLRVVDKDAEKDRAEVQMTGPQTARLRGGATWFLLSPDNHFTGNLL
jgi:hypothetical protein